jgi:hypothetical protein
VVVDGRLIDQYTKVFTVAAADPESADNSVIKLFDE